MSPGAPLHAGIALIMRWRTAAPQRSRRLTRAMKVMLSALFVAWGAEAQAQDRLDDFNDASEVDEVRDHDDSGRGCDHTSDIGTLQERGP